MLHDNRYLASHRAPPAPPPQRPEPSGYREGRAAVKEEAAVGRGRIVIVMIMIIIIILIVIVIVVVVVVVVVVI